MRTTGEFEELGKPLTVGAIMTINVKPNGGLFSCCTSLPVKITANVDIKFQEEGGLKASFPSMSLFEGAGKAKF